MRGIKLRDAVKRKKTVTVEQRPTLYARRCDSCGRLFDMPDTPPWSADQKTKSEKEE